MKRNKILLILISAVVILSIGFVIYQNISSYGEKICIEKKKCFVVKIAENEGERIKGLSGEKSLDENAGMFFMFEEETIPSFWMKEMNFPIDIIWINEERIIVGIERNLKPCLLGGCPLFSPNQPIRYVLEINSNSSAENNITEGDRVYF